MSEKAFLIGVHTALMLLQIGAVALAIGVDSKWSALSAPIGLAQAFFPRPEWKTKEVKP